MFIEPTTVAVGVLDAFEQRKRLMPAIRKLHYWAEHGRLLVLSFGPGGTGKTTLGRLLSGKVEAFPQMKPYEASTLIEDYKLPGDIVATLIVPPGQKRHIRSIWPDLYVKLPRGRAGGVINLVSYGYHTFDEESYHKHTLYQKGMTTAQFMHAYLASRREEELRIIRELTPRLADSPNPDLSVRPRGGRV
jgi:energy-coupling factor transporter ATP-binding protein EcfA2